MNERAVRPNGVSPRAKAMSRPPAPRGTAAAAVALSALGAANMAAVSLRQLGLVAHLPDPPLRGFDADRVTTSHAAYLFGIPDAPLETLSLLANIPLVRLAASGWGERHPSLPLLLGAKSLAEAAIALWYFEHMRRHVRAWCAYCLAGTAINLALATLTVPVARRAAARASPATTAAAVAVTIAGVLLWRTARGRK